MTAVGQTSALFGADRLIQLTCNPPLTNFTLTKLLWVRENEPRNWKRVAHVMLPKDYVRFQLTGERAIDMADASGTLWRQIQAYVYGHAVEVVQAEEGAAYGAAILAGVGAGNWRSVDEACDAVVQTAHKIQPDPNSSAILDEAYRVYRRIYPALREISNRESTESAAQPVAVPVSRSIP